MVLPDTAFSHRWTSSYAATRMYNTSMQRYHYESVIIPFYRFKALA